MSFRKEDGVSSLCQKALHIITELCFAGQVEWDKCSGIFPADRSSQGGGSTGKGIRLGFPGQEAFSGQTSWLELVLRGLGGLALWICRLHLLGLCCALPPAALASQGFGALACPAGCSRIIQPGRRTCAWPQGT